MLRLKHPADYNRSLKEIYSYLLPTLSNILGYPASIQNWPATRSGRSYKAHDGCLEMRLPGKEGREGPFCIRLPSLAANDKLCRQVIARFFRLCEDIVEVNKRRWAVKAHLVKQHDFIWDNLILSLFFRGDQKYECIDILGAIRETLIFKYEGEHVNPGVLISKNLHNIIPKLSEYGCTLLPFQRSFDLRENLRTFKAMNRLSTTRSCLLVVSGDAVASHLLLLPSSLSTDAGEDWELVPSEIRRLSKILKGRDILISASTNNEMFLTSGHTVFKWDYKKWRRVSGPSISKLLQPFLSDTVATRLTEIANVMSITHRGGLFVISENPQKLLSGAKGGLSRSFQDGKFFNILDVDPWTTARFAAVDGATVIDRSGSVIEAGAILSIPETHQSPGEGARTVAASFASNHGIAVKISHDGPIAIYADGRLIRTTA